MQQANEKTAEPSMEDILASIRKIIAEEPAGQTSAQRPSAAPPAPPPVAARPISTAPSLRPVMPPVAARSAEPPLPISNVAGPSRLSDIMREFAPTAVPLTSPTVVSFHDDLDDLVESASPVQRDAKPDPVPAPAPAAAQVAEVADVRPELNSPVAAAWSPTPETATVMQPSDARPVDLGSFVPMNRDAFSAMPRADARMELRLPDFNRVDRGPPIDGVSEPVPLPLPPLPQLAVKAEEAPVAAPRPEPEPSIAETANDDSIAAAQSALGALALGLAAPAGSMVVSPQPRQVQPHPVQHLVSAPEDSTRPVRRQTLDDAVVEMLRPMVREWLDAHLPEMVEQALRLEMGDALKRQN